MATEITWAARHRLHPAHVERVGGPGWGADAATVIGQIEEGREYFLRDRDALLRISPTRLHGRLTLSTDLSESAENQLLSLPSSPVQGAAALERSRAR